MLQALFQRNVVSEVLCRIFVAKIFQLEFSYEDHFLCWNDWCRAIFWSILSLKIFLYPLGFVDRSFWGVFWADIVLYETLLWAQSTFLASTKDNFTMISCYFYDVILLSVTSLVFSSHNFGWLCLCVFRLSGFAFCVCWRDGTWMVFLKVLFSSGLVFQVSRLICLYLFSEVLDSWLCEARQVVLY